MSEYYNDVFVELHTLQETLWPEVTIIFRAQQTAKIPWQDLIERAEQSVAGGWAPPYVVNQLLPVIPSPEWSGLDRNVYLMRVITYYIRKHTLSAGEIAAGTGITRLVEQKAEAYRDLLSPPATFTNFNLFENVIIDSTEKNQANAAFLSFNAPLQAVAIMADFYVGS